MIIGIALGMALGGLIWFAKPWLMMVAMLATGGIFGECAHELGGVTSSADGRLKAGVMVIGCGATTRDRTLILLTTADKPFDADRDAIAGLDGNGARVQWERGGLVVYYDQGGAPWKQTSRWNGVPVTFRIVPVPAPVDPVREAWIRGQEKANGSGALFGQAE